MSLNSTSKVLRANEVESLGTMPEGDSEQFSLYQISTTQTVPASHSFFLLPCPKMELNAGTWRDLRDHQVCGSQTLVCAKAVWLEPLESWLNRIGTHSLHTQILIQKTKPGGVHILCVYKAPLVTLVLSHPHLHIHTPSSYRWPREGGTSTCSRSHC